MDLELTSAAMMAFVCANVTLAQDRTTVEPTHCHLAGENDGAPVVRVHYKPHQSSKLDSHPGGLVVYLTEGTSDENGSGKELYGGVGESAASFRRSTTGSGIWR